MSASVCIKHPDRVATARCTTCHKPVCDSCVVEISGSKYCSKTCADNAARFQATFRPERSPGFFSKLTNLIISLVGMALVAAVAIVLLAKVAKIDFFVNLLKKFGL